MDWMPFGEKSLAFIKRPLSRDAKINILTGAVRSSKTVTMIPKWIRYIEEGPKGLLLMTGVSKDTIYDNVLRDLFDTVGNKHYKYNRQSGDLKIFDRELKVIGAKDEGSEKYLRGKTVAGAYCDEMSLIPEKFFRQLLNRLSVKDSKLYGTTNPDNPAHYLYRDFITDLDKVNSGLVDVIQFLLDDNPNLDEDYKRDITRTHSGLFYKRFILGEWVMGEGAIYDMWTDANVYTELPKYFHSNVPRRYVSIDYGTQNPMVFLYIIDDIDANQIYVEEEYYYDGRKTGIQKTDSQYADDLQAFIADKDIDYVIIDPSAASFKAELRNRDIRVKDADNEVADGIHLTASLIGRQILKVNSLCVNTIREMCAYVWDPKKTDKGKEQPLKKDDHCPDGIRYFVKTIFKPRRLIA